jgi:CTD small phosphatase-like protein 2
MSGTTVNCVAQDSKFDQDLIDYYKQFIDILILIKQSQIFIEEQIKFKKITAKETSKNTLIFDLDETLVYASSDGSIIKRPFLSECIDELSKHYNIWIWTAASASHADPIINEHVDPSGKYIQRVLYRDSCIELAHNILIKDLRILDGCDISKYAIIDNQLISFITCMSNGILCDTFDGNTSDCDLLTITKFFLSNTSNCNLALLIKSTFKAEEIVKYIQSGE